MLNLTRLHLGIAHESQFQGLGITVPEIVAASKELLKKPFTPSHAVQILAGLADKGLIYRNRRASYCFAVPLLARFIQRQTWDPATRRGQIVSTNGP